MNSYSLKEAEPSVQLLIQRIAEMAGIDQEVEVVASDVPVTCTTLFTDTEDGKPGKPVIAYNPVFIDELNKANPYAVTAAIAQEMAYHYNQNFQGMYEAELIGEKVRASKKVNPDKFTGWVLWHEGIQLEEAMKLYNIPRFSQPYVNQENQRKTVMRAGWIRAHERMKLPPRFDRKDFVSSTEERGIEQMTIDSPHPKVSARSTDTENILFGLAALALLAGGISMLGRE
jgi:hypothetical protein